MNNFIFLLKINGFFLLGSLYLYLNKISNFKYLSIYLLISNILLLLSSMIKFYSRIKSYNINKIDINNIKFKDLNNKLLNISNKYKIKKPKLIIYQGNELNAFATGIFKNNSYIFISYELFNFLNEEELESILFHEFSHIKNNDLLKQLITESFIDSFTFYTIPILKIINLKILKIPILSNFMHNLLLIIEAFFNLFFNFIGLFISRINEYNADRFSAQEMDSSFNLIKSLSKITNVSKEFQLNSGLQNNFIKMNWGSDLWSTHPKTYKRIKKLEELI